MPITLPTSVDVRKARTQARKTFDAQFDLVRAPLLAWIGVNDLAVQTVRELPDKLSREKLRDRADDAADAAYDTYEELAERGETSVQRIRTQPQVARVLRTVKDLNVRANKQLDTIVDELHDAGQDLLGSISSQTRSAGEKTARRTQRAACDVATIISEASTELASEIVHAGDDSAHDTRSATRTAANKTAPAKTINGHRVRAS